MRTTKEAQKVGKCYFLPKNLDNWNKYVTFAA